MGGCAAFNCSNHSRKGYRMFRFPSEPERRKKWIVNCRRNDPEPGRNAQLCIVHFEESQFESHREGVKMLKKHAVPTLFDVPNPPPTFDSKRKKGFGCPKLDSILARKAAEKENYYNEDLMKRIEVLENENRILKEKVKEYEDKFSSLSAFLSNEQINALAVGRFSIPNWSENAIIKGLKIRFAVGKHGYNYLRETGYPVPAYSTLNRRIQGIQINFGVMDQLFILLKAKVDAMDSKDKNCCIMFDEMDIASHQDFDTSTKSFTGNVTLGTSGAANHYCLVMLRGLCSSWKQVVAHELTGPSTSGDEMKSMVFKSIDAARGIGLKVRASTSDMGSSNKAYWSSAGVRVSRNERSTFYATGESDETIHSIADVPHLLKNMRSAFLTRVLILPEATCQEHELPSTIIDSEFLKKLWKDEINSDSALRSLHHLNKIHLFPTHFSSMNVAPAVQLFSVKTAAALEKAVIMRQIEKSALTTAWWIRIMAQWFETMTARHPKCGITLKNKEEKFHFLHSFINIMQNIQLGKGWKPLQTGMIMSTLSIINLVTDMFDEGFTFFLPGRLTQDALENVFSQIRRKSATKPTALQAKRALKLICVSQFISDIHNSNYASDSDFHLLRTISANDSVSGVTPCEVLENTVEDLISQSSETISDDSDDTLSDVAPHEVVEDSMDDLISQPSCSSKPQISAMQIASQENDIYYITGATLKAILSKKKFCELCQNSLKNAEDNLEPDVPYYRTYLTDYRDMGGLIKPNSGVYRICREAERQFQKNREQLLKSQVPISKPFIDAVMNNCSHINLPSCCQIKEAVINYYLIVRCKGLKNYLLNKRSYDISFGSASLNKKQKKG